MPPNQELVSYIKQSLTQGISREIIRQSLIQAGWDENNIEQAFLDIGNIDNSDELKSSPQFSSTQPIASGSFFKKHFLAVVIAGFALLTVAGGISAYYFYSKNIKIKRFDSLPSQSYTDSNSASQNQAPANDNRAKTNSLLKLVTNKPDETSFGEMSKNDAKIVFLNHQKELYKSFGVTKAEITGRSSNTDAIKKLLPRIPELARRFLTKESYELMKINLFMDFNEFIFKFILNTEGIESVPSEKLSGFAALNQNRILVYLGDWYTTLIYDLVKTDGGWKIDMIESLRPESICSSPSKRIRAICDVPDQKDQMFVRWELIKKRAGLADNQLLNEFRNWWVASNAQSKSNFLTKAYLHDNYFYNQDINDDAIIALFFERVGVTQNKQEELVFAEEEFPDSGEPNTTLPSLILSKTSEGMWFIKEINNTNPKDARRISDVMTIKNMLNVHYRNNNSKYPASLSDAKLTSMYTLPRDPESDKNYFYAVNGSLNSYHLGANLEEISDHLQKDQDCNSLTGKLCGESVKPYKNGFNGEDSSGCFGEKNMHCFDITNLYQETKRTNESEGGTAESRDARRIADIKQLQLALELYFDKYLVYPSVSLDKLAPDFIPAIPKDPMDNTSYYYYSCGKTLYHLATDLESKDNQYLAYDTDRTSPSCVGEALKEDLIIGDDARSCIGNINGRFCYDVTN